jgi:hypothetical protein
MFESIGLGFWVVLLAHPMKFLGQTDRFQALETLGRRKDLTSHFCFWPNLALINMPIEWLSLEVSRDTCLVF